MTNMLTMSIMGEDTGISGDGSYFFNGTLELKIQYFMFFKNHYIRLILSWILIKKRLVNFKTIQQKSYKV